MRIQTLAAVAGLALGASAHLPVFADRQQHQPEVVVLDSGIMQARNGVMVQFVKSIVDGVDTMEYTHEGRKMTVAELRAWEDANPLPVVDTALLEEAAKKLEGDAVLLTVLLKSNPYPRMKMLAKDAAAAKYAAIDAEIDALTREQFTVGVGAIPMTEDDMLRVVEQGGFRLTPEQRVRLRNANEARENLDREIRDSVIALTRPMVADDLAALRGAVASLGGEIERELITSNGATIKLPAKALPTLAQHPLIARIFENPAGSPELSITVPSLGVPATFWANGFDGGIWDAGVLDSGAQQNHPCFSGLNFFEAPSVGLTDSDGHGTAVSSIIASRDATRRGVAFGVGNIAVGFANSMVSHADWMCTTLPEEADVINISWNLGNPPFEYGDLERFVDGLVDGEGNNFIKSCGNEGPGDNTLTRPGTNYNGMSVANVNFNGTQTRNDDFISGSSSRGPTTSGRRKPDVAAPSQGVQAAERGWATGDDWGGFGGTSGAAPHVTGLLLLLADGGDSVPMRAKSILINSADTFDDNNTVNSDDDDIVVGSAWNKTYGWGYINGARAYLHRANNLTGTVDDGTTPVGPDYKLYRGTLGANAKATLVWERHVGYNGTSFPTAVQNLSDLDLLVYNADTNLFATQSSTTLNNVEQVSVPTTIADAVLKVEVFNNLDPDVSVESYSLTTASTFTAVDPPNLAAQSTLGTVSPGQEFTHTVQVLNNGGLPAHNIRVTVTAPLFWGNVGPETIEFDKIEVGASVFARFTLRAPCVDIAGSNIPFSVTSNSYGETFTVSGDSYVTLNDQAAALTQDTVVASTILPRTYPFTVAANEFNVVATSVGNGTGDVDVSVDSNICSNDFEAASSASGTTRDYVVVNGYNPAVTDDSAHALVSEFTTAASYGIEYDRGFDISYPGTRVESFTVSEIIEVMEFNVPASGVNKLQRISVIPSSGNTDFELALYRPTTTYAARSGGAIRNAGGPGVAERMNFLPTTAGVHAVVVVNRNTTAGTFTFRAHCYADWDGSGTASIDDIFYFLNAWFAADPDTDVDLGGYNIDDVFLFLNRWFEGC